MAQQINRNKFSYDNCVRGGALVYAVVAVTIITAFSLLLLSYFNINYKLLNSIKKNEIVHHYIYSGVAKTNSLIDDREYEVMLDGSYKLILSKKKWGVYNKCYTTLISNDNDTVSRAVALLGNAKNINDSIALLVYNNKILMHIGEKVQIIGKAFFPSSTIVPYQGYNDFNSVHRIGLCPDTNVDMREANLLVTQVKHFIKLNTRNSMTIADSIHKSFYEPTYLLTGDTLYITGKLSGNIVIAAGVIIIDSIAELRDVILCANNVTFLSDFSGTVQVFATDVISVGDRAIFNYPSCLAILPDAGLIKMVKQEPQIIIKDSVTIIGTVYAYSSTKYSGRKPVIITGNGFKLVGGMYSSASIDIRGHYYGSIICNKLTQRKLAEDNLILNTVINIDSLPEYFSYDIHYPYSGSQKIVKWLERK